MFDLPHLLSLGCCSQLFILFTQSYTDNAAEDLHAKSNDEQLHSLSEMAKEGASTGGIDRSSTLWMEVCTYLFFLIDSAMKEEVNCQGR